MSKQSEAVLEESLIKQLEGLSFKRVTIETEEDLLKNFKTKLEVHNKISISEDEFKKILNHLSRGNVFEKAKTLRDKFVLECDDGDKKYIEFLNVEHWCQNIYQVTNQITIEGKYTNRYDVTLLVNGLPLVQIELKRRGLELKEAFNQIGRYQKHSFGFGASLFQYVQVFVISNGENTKYYANNRKTSFKQTFFWADEKNNNITDLTKFANAFLEPCHISKMICKYIVLNETENILMVLRSYQFFAVERIIDRVNNSDKNGYIWHTTGSGKTLTSFKAAQILTKLPTVEKVVFVVDRKDLDDQTIKEFNGFSKGSVDGTDNTKKLVAQFSDDTQLIVTTLQKLNTAISKERYLKTMEDYKDSKIVFIFDECHRSQFGDTHQRITSFFTKAQLFGFTGTPIFDKNATYKKTTKDLFEEQLHSYVITDAIKDENVLRFIIEYVGKYKEKAGSKTNIDIEVEAIDTKELLESETRVERIVDYILANHDYKTKSREFTAMMCVSNVDMLIKYYETFKKKNHNLKIATIFSYTANEEDKDATGLEESDELNIDESKINKHSREKLDEYIADYNKMFATKYSTDSKEFYNYYRNVAKRVKTKEIDILLVVNMFLTGFDSKTLNTLYVDKNLKYHGLIQAFSRTNRVLAERKSQGNIICFRNLKKNTDDAIALFSNKEAKEEILMDPYEEYVERFNEKAKELFALAPTPSDVDNLADENAEFEFITTFRSLIRLMNILVTFADFSFSDLIIDEQRFEEYKSKYLDLYEKTKSTKEKEKVSIIDDVDFELELIHKDIVNVAYILSLLARYLEEENTEKKAKQKEEILQRINNEVSLRSKRELIERFINETLEGIKKTEDIEEEFYKFLRGEEEKEFEKFCQENDLNKERISEILQTYLYDGRRPLQNDVAKAVNTPLKVLERKRKLPKIIDKLLDLVEKFYD